MCVCWDQGEGEAGAYVCGSQHPLAPVCLSVLDHVVFPDAVRACVRACMRNAFL